MLENHVGILRRDLDDIGHIAEAGGEDDVVALLGVVADDPIGIGAFCDKLTVGRLDIIELTLHIQASLVVGIGPAEIARRPNVDEGDLQLLSRYLGDGRFAGSFSRYPLDEPTHTEHFAIGHGLALGDCQLATLSLDGAAEDVPFAADDLGFPLRDQCLDIVGNHGAVGSQAYHTVLHATPVFMGCPGSVHDSFDGIQIVDAPVPDGAGEDGSGGLHAHVGVIAHTIDPTFLGGLLGLRSILVLSDDVSAQIEEPFGGFFLLHGVEPGVGPDDVYLSIWIRLPHAQGESVDAS